MVDGPDSAWRNRAPGADRTQQPDAPCEGKNGSP